VSLMQVSTVGSSDDESGLVQIEAPVAGLGTQVVRMTVTEAIDLASRLLNLCTAARYVNGPDGDVTRVPYYPVPIPVVRLRLNRDPDDPSEAVEMRTREGTVIYLGLTDARQLALQIRSATRS